MYGIRENLYNEILELFKNTNVKKAYIFGSRARGDYKKILTLILLLSF